MASVEGLTKVNELIQGTTDQFAQQDKMKAAQQAAELFKAGNIKDALGTILAHDPDRAAQLVQQFQAYDPSTQGSLKQAETAGGLQAQTDFGSNPAQLQALQNKGALDTAKARPKNSTYQVRNPLTQEVEIRDRGTGEIVQVVGSPEKIKEIDPEADPKDFNPKILFKSLNPKERKYYDDIQKDFMKDTKEDREALEAAGKVQGLLAGGKDIGNDIIRAVQNQLSTATGDRGSRTEMDVKPFGGRSSVIAQLERIISTNATGKLPEKDRKFLTELADVMANGNGKAILNRSGPFAAKLATQSSLNEEKARNLLLQGLVGLPDDEGAKGNSKQTGKAEASAAPKTVMVKQVGKEASVGATIRNNKTGKSFIVQPDGSLKPAGSLN